MIEKYLWYSWFFLIKSAVSEVLTQSCKIFYALDKIILLLLIQNQNNFLMNLSEKRKMIKNMKYQLKTWFKNNKWKVEYLYIYYWLNQMYKVTWLLHSIRPVIPNHSNLILRIPQYNTVGHQPPHPTNPITFNHEGVL